MKTSRQEMESELQELRPRLPSDRVLASITSELVRAPAVQRSMRWRNARRALALAVAASVTIAMFWWTQPEQIEVRSPSLSIVERQHTEPPEMLPPTSLAYQHTLRQSPDDLNELLDRHAKSLLGSGSPSSDIASLYSELLPN